MSEVKEFDRCDSNDDAHRNAQDQREFAGVAEKRFAGEAPGNGNGERQGATTELKHDVASFRRHR